MNTEILSCRPERLTPLYFSVLRANPALRDRYNRRWNVALF